MIVCVCTCVGEEDSGRKREKESDGVRGIGFGGEVGTRKIDGKKEKECYCSLVFHQGL